MIVTNAISASGGGTAGGGGEQSGIKYSLDEQKIGTWYWGNKPLYQKTFSFPINKGSTNDFIYNTDIKGADEIWIYDGFITDLDYHVFHPITNYFNAKVWLDNSNGKLYGCKIVISRDISINDEPCIITLRYTKLSD